ncbi:serine hydrolase domain-containing protein [Nocardioides litoris]|uniref:serine hydrolase domain-containing protein n=1 Tax=Nocardioides litoris TaxID=1926648 RepID=UPI00112252B5|nr:serine hydrolase [Nocardioides litoris]
MGRAQQVVDLAVDLARSRGFGLQVVHARVGDDEAQHAVEADVARDVHSVAKGLCVLAVGVACDEGRYDVDVPVLTYLPDVVPGPGVEAVTTRHLLGMTSGIDLPWSPTLFADWPDVAHEMLSRPAPARAFQYSTASTYTAVRALAAVVGDVAAWVQDRLLDPLGIDPPAWERCPQGYVVGAGGLPLRCAETARLGRLVRDDGLWDGRRLVAARWPRAMHSGWWERPDAAPGYRRYALAGWDGPGPAWRLHGAHGQLVLFLGDTVVTVAADDHAGADGWAAELVARLGARAR